MEGNIVRKFLREVPLEFRNLGKHKDLCLLLSRFLKTGDLLT